MKKHLPLILTIAIILLCTIWLTILQDRAQRDRAMLFEGLIEQSWKMQTDTNGLWKERDPGQFVRTLPEETAPSVRQYLLDAAERDEAVRHLLSDIDARLNELEQSG